MRGTDGFTLLELLVVTVVLGILALLAAIPLGKAREAAMVSAAKAELRQLVYAIELYQTERYVLPPTLAALRSFSRSGDIRICTFAVAEGAGGPTIELEAQHRGSKTRVSSVYPDEAVSFQERTVGAVCPDVGDGGGGAGSGGTGAGGAGGGAGAGPGNGGGRGGNGNGAGPGNENAGGNGQGRGQGRSGGRGRE